MSKQDETSFEQMLAVHSAPTLLGVKCGNLFAVHQSDFCLDELSEIFESKFGNMGLKIRFLCSCRERALVYVYSKDLLEMWFAEEKTASFMKEYGYSSDMTLDEKLSLLESRINCGSFPHEIGAFLGYPIDDIRGFIENEGQNFLLCGFWKVYSNPADAQNTFDRYIFCKNYLCNKIDQGMDLIRALSIFKEETL